MFVYINKMPCRQKTCSKIHANTCVNKRLEIIIIQRSCLKADVLLECLNMFGIVFIEKTFLFTLWNNYRKWLNYVKWLNGVFCLTQVLRCILFPSIFNMQRFVRATTLMDSFYFQFYMATFSNVFLFIVLLLKIVASIRWIFLCASLEKKRKIKFHTFHNSS